MARAPASAGLSGPGRLPEDRRRRAGGARLAGACAAALLLTAPVACQKVPLTDIYAGFTLADAAWFEEEQTLFLFWRLEAAQGIGPESRIEISYRTDDLEQPWAPVADLATVHTHVAVDCGVRGLCGSTSLHVAKQPRLVQLRMRYHRDGEMFLDAPLYFNVVGRGPAHTNRSLIVYGVFDETNTRVQWRARHQFPALRNEEAQELGLRRSFRVAEPRFGETGELPWDNPYGYGSSDRCPEVQMPLGWSEVGTTERAVFDPNALPLAASTSPAVCARSIVTDALGTFEAVALARKNPEVRAAFPSLRSPVRENRAVGFLLRPCARTISEEHEQVQRQRLLLGDPVEVCLDDWSAPGFAETLASRVRAEIDRVRAQGEDMVLAVAFHHDDTSGRLSAIVEEVLEAELAFERDKSSPRVSGAFVFDSFGYTLTRPQLSPLALWCPAKLPSGMEELPSTSASSCPLLPDMPDLKLGPFKFSQLPILPTRRQYLTFVEKYSDGQAGRMRALRFLAPERTPLSENVAVPPYGVATFFNNEILSAQAEEAFSYCAGEDMRASAVVFRHPLSPDPVPLSYLPEAHNQAPMGSYPLGLYWDFPFLLRLEYETSIAGAATAYSFTVPFGISDTTNAYYGTQLWETGEFPLTEVLTQCTRFCEHPTFDSAGVYNVLAPFRFSYAGQCYRPRYPLPTDGGFPLDP